MFIKRRLDMKRKKKKRNEGKYGVKLERRGPMT